jgi:CelD/BcsL family acetyltransferase involved in cellulose biosynthesis
VIEDSYLKSYSGSHICLSFKIVEKLKSPYVIINCDWSDYWYNKVSKSLRKNISQQETKAEKKYGITFEPISGNRLHPSDLEEAFSIEDSGWKGERGSSLLKNPLACQFYREIAFAMNKLGCFELFFLSFGGKRIAFEYNLKSDSILYPLKIGYNEAYKKFSPGAMIWKMVIHYAFMNHFQKFDMLGSTDGYKLKWTKETEVLSGVYIFNRRIKSLILKFFMFRVGELASKLGIKVFLKSIYLKMKDILKRK